MFETLSPSLTVSSAPVPAIPAKARRPAPFAPLPSLRPLTGKSFLLFAFVYLYSFPYFDRLRSANEMPRILMAQEIVERQTCRIDARLGEMGSRFDTSRGVDGHMYSNKAPGPSFLAVPVYAVLKFFKATSIQISTWAFRVFVITIPALFFLPLFYRLTARFTPDEPARRAALVAYALGSSALPYSVLFLSHQLAAICLGGAFLAAVTLVRDETARPKLTALLVGALCAAAVLMDYQTLFISPVVGLYALVRGRNRLRNVGLFVLGAIPFAVALGAYHQVQFGSPLNTPLATSNEAATKSGFMGLIGPNWKAFYVLLFDPSNGLFVLMPWAVLAFLGFVAIFADRASRRRVGAEAITCLVIVLVYLGVLGSLVPSYARAGWAVGPRYLGASFPFLAWLTASGIAAAYRLFVTRVLVQGLVLVSVVIFLGAVSTFPHWPDGLRSPLHELTFRLVREGYAAHSIGTALGLKGIWAQAPLYLFSIGFAIWLLARGVRKGAVGVVLACALAGGVLYAYGHYFPPTGPYAEHAWRWVTRIWEPPPGPKIPWLATTIAVPPAPVVPPKPPAVVPPRPGAPAAAPAVVPPKPGAPAPAPGKPASPAALPPAAPGAPPAPGKPGAPAPVAPVKAPPKKAGPTKRSLRPRLRQQRQRREGQLGLVPAWNIQRIERAVEAGAEQGGGVTHESPGRTSPPPSPADGRGRTIGLLDGLHCPGRDLQLEREVVAGPDPIVCPRPAVCRGERGRVRGAAPDTFAAPNLPPT
jgi:hypothetical protein